MTRTEYGTLLDNVRERKPLVHHITNYVTANDSANITLGIGAAPIMADALNEAAQISAASSALVLNMGTLNERTVPAMIAAGKAANQAAIPVIFDPVGAGASTLRNEASARITQEIDISVLRGNISEIRFITGLGTAAKGVDADEKDLGKSSSTAQRAAATYRCIVAVTGPVDTIAYARRRVSVRNGHPLLARLTGTGCMCSSLIGALCGANPETLFNATVTAIAAMGIAGEMAYNAAGERGNGSFRIALHDAVSRLDSVTVAARAKIDEETI